jgi:hypothetical protein
LVPDGAGLAGQDQKRSLESVFSVVFIAQDVPADAPDQPAMALDQRREGSVVLVMGETPQ